MAWFGEARNGLQWQERLGAARSAVALNGEAGVARRRNHRRCQAWNGLAGLARPVEARHGLGGSDWQAGLDVTRSGVARPGQDRRGRKGTEWTAGMGQAWQAWLG